MKKHKVEFPGSFSTSLSGLMEMPDQNPRAFVLFAHCFTCGKDIAAASRVARSLVQRGFAVLRFDFTGLGGSDGDFANTSFSSNVQDLIAATDYLRREWRAPELLIGHSLGGTAVLKAAESVSEVTGVVTIGSPADANHVAKQFQCHIDEIESEGEAQVSLAGRPFTIKKQFLDDINEQAMPALQALGKALLVMHSPVDNVVSVNEAEKIYRAARHPKSFVSLDNADHLLSAKADAEYVAETIAAWASRFVGGTEIVEVHQNTVASGEVKVVSHNDRFTQEISTDTHHWFADEPTRVGGDDLGPDPYDHLLASLGACTSMTLRMYANRKKWPLDGVEIVLRHHREHGDDCANCDEANPQIDVITRVVRLSGHLDESMRARLLEIADRCPVHKTMTGKIEIVTEAG
ncbi:MAG: alpha/beta fold hydrolase [Pseudomonadota bacterium]